MRSLTVEELGQVAGGYGFEPDPQPEEDEDELRQDKVVVTAKDQSGRTYYLMLPAVDFTNLGSNAVLTVGGEQLTDLEELEEDENHSAEDKEHIESLLEVLDLADNISSADKENVGVALDAIVTQLADQADLATANGWLDRASDLKKAAAAVGALGDLIELGFVGGDMVQNGVTLENAADGLGIITAAIAGAAAGSVVPGPGTLVGFLVGLGTGLVADEAWEVALAGAYEGTGIAMETWDSTVGAAWDEWMSDAIGTWNDAAQDYPSSTNDDGTPNYQEYYNTWGGGPSSGFNYDSPNLQ